MLVSVLCTLECRCPLRPQEGIGSPRADVTLSGRLSDAGAGNQTQILCKRKPLFRLSSSSKCFVKGVYASFFFFFFLKGIVL